MAGEAWIDKAVVTLAAYVAANLPAKLRAVEVAQGLTTDSLTDPVAVLSYRVPFDNRAPLVEVYDEGWSFVNVLNKIVKVDCTITISFVGGSDVGAGEAFMRRYISAVIDLIVGAPTLGNAVIAATPTDGSPAIARGDDSSTRFVYSQGVDVHVQG